MAPEVQKHTVYSGLDATYWWFIRCSCGYARFQKHGTGYVEKTAQQLTQEHLASV